MTTKTEKNKKPEALPVTMVDNKLLLKIEKKDVVRTQSGILLSKQSADSTTEFGTVVAAGPGLLSEHVAGNRLPINCKIGDRVVVPRSAGISVYIQGEQYRFIRDADIIAIVPDSYAHDDRVPEDETQDMIKEALAQAGKGVGR